jgi:C4-dicarboxylate-specific signal transduction histidine kinase
MPVHRKAEDVGHVDGPPHDAGVYSKVLRDVSSRILHEIAPLIGGLMACAPSEIKDYGASQTRLLIEQLSARSEALRNMRTATATPKFEEFDLSALVSELLAAEQSAGGANIIITGAEKFFVSADRSQLSMALSNGLRNGLEAVKSVSGRTPNLVISWGATQHENWLFIKDNGPGLQHPATELLKDGISDKDGHSGYGLSLAREAMISMQGEILLRNDEDGAHFELRWYRKNEDTVS